VRIETVPLILGVLVAMLGIGIMFDAWTPDAAGASRERRRRPRVERHRNGEAMIGLGVLGLAAAFIGRDNWRYSILVVIIGALFLIVGAVLNARYVREMFVNRGPLRRREQTGQDLNAAGREEVERAQPMVSEASPPSSTRVDWNGVDRRKVPREGGRKSQRRDSSSDDPLAPNP
jgi:hypothetical protein